MTDKSIQNIFKLIGVTAYVTSMGITLTSCERMFEELEPCPHGMELRFVYDYNMEWANAFPAQVDCLTLYVYDSDDRYVTTRVVTGSELADEDYRMTLELAPGTYRLVAYGGLACDDATFSVVDLPRQGTGYSDLRVAMDLSVTGAAEPSQRRLHDLFYGELTLASADNYSSGTVRMMKDTNNIRVVLQQEAGGEVNPDDFEFSITDNNSMFACDNTLVTDGVEEVVYRPWSTGQARTGVSIVGNNVTPLDVTVAYAELSTSRIVSGNAPRLIVSRRSDGGTVVDFPLITYLSLLMSDRYSKPPYNITDSQEYLDRESDYSVVFFLRPDNTWLDTRLVINDWVVRINNTEF